MSRDGALPAGAIALSAFLLFLVEPLAARELLPAFGGSAAVWLTSVLFFQVALLAGYGVAHAAARALEPRRRLWLLAGLLALGLWCLPPDAARLARLLAAAPDPGSAGGALDAARVLASLALSVGLPFLGLAALGPLVQSVWAERRGSPYRLYALSNGASLAGLLAYPGLLEPAFEVGTHAGIWAAGFGLLFLLVLAHARNTPPGPSPSPTPTLSPTLSPTPTLSPSLSLPPAPTPPRVWSWLWLPACTSALLLAVTAHLTRDLAPIPLLWVAPLGAYLLSFVVAFEGRRPPLRRVWLPLGAVGLLWLGGRVHALPPDWLAGTLAAEVLAFFAVCTAAHGELSRERPAAAGSTRFYLWTSLGSTLGSSAVVLLAPLLFATELELPLSLWLLAVGLVGLLWREPLRVPGWLPRTRVARTAELLCLLVLALQLGVLERRFRAPIRWAGRSFYSALRLEEFASDDGATAKAMLHGSTTHGLELLPPGRPDEPMGYYTRGSGVGRTLGALREDRGPLRVGVVGLGIGVVAAYCRPGDRFTFFELDPLVARVAREQFGFLSRCPGAEVRVGDGRLLLSALQPQRFDLLLLDAFASDSVPTHLLTREAFALYRGHLAPGGALVVHISNRFADLAPVVAGQAAELGLPAFALDQRGTAGSLVFDTRFVLLTAFAPLLARPSLAGVRPPEPLSPQPGLRLWTDGYTSLVRLLR